MEEKSERWLQIESLARKLIRKAEKVHTLVSVCDGEERVSGGALKALSLNQKAEYLYQCDEGSFRIETPFGTITFFCIWYNDITPEDVLNDYGFSEGMTEEYADAVYKQFLRV